MAKASPVTITRDDWLKAIEETQKAQVDTDPDVMSYYDFAAKMGCVIGTARVKLDALVKAGRAKKVSKMVIAGDGRLRRVVAFRLVKK